MGTDHQGLNHAQVKEVLLEQRATLLDRVRRLEKDIHHREEPIPADFAEQATELENKEVMEALDDDARQELRKIDRALKRMADGEYGECMNCGTQISPRRLAALPSATLCIECASQAEQRRP